MLIYIWLFHNCVFLKYFLCKTCLWAVRECRLIRRHVDRQTGVFHSTASVVNNSRSVCVSSGRNQGSTCRPNTWSLSMDQEIQSCRDLSFPLTHTRTGSLTDENTGSLLICLPDVYVENWVSFQLWSSQNVLVLDKAYWFLIQFSFSVTHVKVISPYGRIRHKLQQSPLRNAHSVFSATASSLTKVRHKKHKPKTIPVLPHMVPKALKTFFQSQELNPETFHSYRCKNDTSKWKNVQCSNIVVKPCGSFVMMINT